MSGLCRLSELLGRERQLKVVIFPGGGALNGFAARQECQEVECKAWCGGLSTTERQEIKRRDLRVQRSWRLRMRGKRRRSVERHTKRRSPPRFIDLELSARENKRRTGARLTGALQLVNGLLKTPFFFLLWEECKTDTPTISFWQAKGAYGLPSWNRYWYEFNRMVHP